jgi:hypothetical protein
MNKHANENGRGSRASQAGEGAMSRDAARLLRALAATGAYAVCDASPDGGVILRAVKDGISVGGGRHPSAAAAELVDRDLAARERALSGVTRLRISDAGIARLKRQGAAADETFRAQHDDIVDGQVGVGAETTRVRIDASESPLAWLRRRTDRHGDPLIDAAEFQAGERLRRDLTSACMLPNVTVNWDAPAVDVSPGSRDPASQSDRVIAARQRATQALDAVGSDLAGLLLDLCGFLKGLERIERERSWPPRSGKVVAKLALGRLADHYGLERAATGPDRARRVRSWRSVVAQEAGLESAAS